ncbi:MAG: PhnD/SsuA/transferrin family substrate-binding protein, partial [Wenzhouxiangellaceae bacterium]
MSPLIMLLLLALFAMPGSAQETGNPPESAPAPESDPEVPVQSLTGTLGLLVAPDYTPDRAELVYRPLIDYLNNVAGLDIELVVARNYHRYWLDARRNETPALVFEEAHIAAWRMQEFGYQPLVTTAQPQTYSLLTTGALADEPLEAFIGSPISSLPSPSLGYLVLARWYPNPLQQPQILSTATSWLDAVEMVFSAEAEAAHASIENADEETEDAGEDDAPLIEQIDTLLADHAED